MLRYAYHNKSKKKSFFKTINNETDIYRKLDLYDQKKNKFKKGGEKVWRKLVSIIEENLKFSEEIFVKKSLNILLPLIKTNIRKNNYLREFDTKSKFDPFDYKIINKTIDLHVPRIGFYPHNKINNNTKKNENRKELRLKTLYRLIKYAHKNNTNLKMIRMGSWMNENKSFRCLFPNSWRKSKKVIKKNNLATWGQFINYNSSINLTLKNRFIKNYKFPIESYYYQCSVNDLKSYLKSKIFTKK